MKRDAERALDTLTLLYERFEQVNTDLANLDQKIDKQFEEIEDATENAKQAQRLVEVASQAVHDSRTSFSVSRSDFHVCIDAGSRPDLG